MNRQINKVILVGLGYIGLPTAAVLASRGVEVIGFDVNKKAVSMINQGKVHILEPDLDMLVHGAVKEGKLRAVLKPEPADVFIIAVPTPCKKNHKPDLTCVKKAAKAIAPYLEEGNLILLESTSPVGTTRQLSEWLAEECTDLIFPHQQKESNIFIAYCPERVLPGKILRELVYNDRVIGGLNKESAKRAGELYKIFVQGECILTDAQTAEMCKLTENAFRDVNIAFANELSMICDKLDINVWELIQLANRHPRVNILQPGPGVGGHCIAVDPWFIVDSAPERSKLIRAAREINDFKPKFVLQKIREAVKKIGHKPTIACLGLTFKADIDDLRESPALKIVQQIEHEDLGEIIVVEPNILSIGKHVIKNIVQSPLDEALSRAEIIVILVDHLEFKTIDFSSLSNKVIISTREICSNIVKVINE